jgi:D-alanyl-D-alanine carboxypeptidase/D-alanyl-D-alanine-endopeptidase (penicillin-binding protein 4)
MKALGILISIFILSFASADTFAAKHKARAKSAPVQAASIYGTGNLAAEINRILNNSGTNAAVGVYIKSMKYNDTLYTRNEERLFVPASILKVVTAQAALLYLGPEYKFPTRFVTDAPVVNGVINGNLYLVHSGDPSLTYYDLADLMSALKSQKIQRINGNIYIDNTAYDQQNYGPGWIWNDKRFCYAAPINASIINHNCLSFRITPGKTPGHPANIVDDPKYYLSSIQNEVITKASSARSCSLRLGTNTDGTISVSGCMPKGRNVQGVSSVIYDVMEYNKSMVRDLFRNAGIQVTGTIMPGAAPSNLPVLAIHESKPLHVLVNEMLKMSDNIIAGSIFKKIGAIYSQSPGTWENGRSAVSQILSERAGIDTMRMHILDGSGLSRENQISPAQMMQVLDFGFHHYATNYEFISSLPISGVDGTLKRRLRNISWKVRAKTGTMSMSGVVSLAGYAISRDKEPIAFVIIFNGRNGMGWKFREAEDKIVTALTKFSRG